MKGRTILTAVLLTCALLILGAGLQLFLIYTEVDVFPLPGGIVAEKDVPVVMRDGVRLYTNVYRPEEQGVFPVIMSFSAYGKDIDPAMNALKFGILRKLIGLSMGSHRISENTPFEAPDPAYWVPNDYVVIHVDVRGYGRSEGEPRALRGPELDDYVELVEWAGTREWSNGRVGLHGVSYLAIAQWYAAERRPSHLEAIVPWEGVSDGYRDAMYHGGVPETAFYPMWAARMNGETFERIEEPQFGPSRTPLIRDVVEFAKGNLEAIVVPALICGSWSDQGLHTKGSIDAYSRISSKDKWLYTHGRGKWTVYYSPEALEYQKRFLDYFLKRIDNGMANEPRVRLEIRKTIDEYEVRHESEWPLESTVYRQAFLDAANGTLTFEKAKSKGTLTYASTEDEEAVFDIRFQEDTEITGHIKLRLWVSTDKGDDMDILVGLKKLDARGNEVHFEGRENDPNGIVSNGWLRVSHRELHPERSTPWQPFLKHERELRISPGEIVPVEIEILPSSTLFEAGETLRLVVKGRDVFSNAMHHHRRLCNQGNHTIYTGGDHESHLLLPIIPRS
jgi:predicted acyl esterase